MNRLDGERRYLTECYVKKEILPQEYVETSRMLDAALERLIRERAEAVKQVAAHGLREDVAAAVRHFCAAARARFEGCADFDAKRQFLRDHIETVTFDHGHIAIVGSIPMPTKHAALRFRIEAEIDRASIRLHASERANEAQRQARLKRLARQDHSTLASGRAA
jgi:hypothetical protein